MLNSQRTYRRKPTLVRMAAILAVVVSGSTVLFAHDPFSLVVSFRSQWSEGAGCGGDGVCADVLGDYEDLTDGVDAWSNAYGNIQLVTTASTSRTICVDFPDSGPTKLHDAAQFERFVTDVESLDGCYPGAFNTLANTSYGATDIGRDGIDNDLPISAWVYFLVNGVQYELQWKRQGFTGLTDFAPPLKTHYSTSPETWLLRPYLIADDGLALTDECPNCTYAPPPCPEDCATLMVFSTNKPRGRIGLANYVMPFNLAAETAATNRRAKGKGRQ